MLILLFSLDVALYPLIVILTFCLVTIGSHLHVCFHFSWSLFFCMLFMISASAYIYDTMVDHNQAEHNGGNNDFVQ